MCLFSVHYMFVRWQKYKQSHRFNKGFTHRCILVESRRVDGEPRLHHVAFLSSYRTSADGKISAPPCCGSSVFSKHYWRSRG